MINYEDSLQFHIWCFLEYDHNHYARSMRAMEFMNSTLKIYYVWRYVQ